MPEILKNIKAEDRLKKIRIVSENDDVMGGQPEADGMKENDNNAIFDLACSVMHALAEVAKVDQKAIPQILDALGDSRTAGASQRIVNEVNKLAKAAQTAANQANDKANTANTAAATADKKAVTAQNTANTAKTAADNAQTTANKKRNLDDVTFNEFLNINAQNGNGEALLISSNVSRSYSILGVNKDNVLFIYNNLSGSLIETPKKSGVIALTSDIQDTSFGVNQRMQDVTSQRSFGQTYTNNTGKPIWVYASQDYIGGVTISFTIDGVKSKTPAYQNSVYLLIPSGTQYKIEGHGNNQQWMEYR